MAQRIEKGSFAPEFKTNPYPGLFVDIEGLDGCGQSTQIQLLNKQLLKNGIHPVLTKEPVEDCALGKEIRQILKKEKQAEAPLKLQEMFVVNRKDHLEKIVAPSLKSGGMVITDRYFWSTIAFGSLDISSMDLLKMNQNFIIPDITIFLDVHPQESLRRIITSRPLTEFFERQEKLEKVYQTYHWLADKFKEKIIVIPGERKKEEIASEIFSLIGNHPKFSNCINKKICF